MKLAPIALFVYNRPEHTRKTVEALVKNTLANQSDLIIFSDAPKTETQAEAVSKVRQYIHGIEGFKSITVIEQKTNFGLAKSIIEGVTNVVNEHGRIIVLEDDLITSPYFLEYMNTSLEVYKDEEIVMHISGYMFSIDCERIPETFFLRTASCWGWATWDRAWKHFSKKPQKLIKEFTKQKINRFNMDGAYNFWSQVEQNESGQINTWAVFWYASVFCMNGLCLHPAISMVNNIGHDDTGENCRQGEDFFTPLASNSINCFEENIIENSLAYSRTKEFFLGIKPSFTHRVFAALKSRITL